MAEAKVIPADANQKAAMEAVRLELERQASATASLIASRYAFWESVRNTAARFDVDPAEVVGTDVAAMNEEADRSAIRWAAVLVNLQAGRTELVAHTETGKMVLGSLPRGALQGAMNGFPILFLLVVAGVGALAWHTLDCVRDWRVAEADAQRAWNANEAKRLELAQVAAQKGGMVAQAFDDALKTALSKSQAAASDPQPTFQKMAGKGGGLVSSNGSSSSSSPSSGGSSLGPSGSSSSSSTLTTAGKAGASLLLLLFLWWAWQNRKAVKRKVSAWL